MKNTILFFVVLLLITSCKVPDESASADESTSMDTTTSVGSIERLDAALDNLIDADASIEILSDGYDWSEGPVWVESEKMLLFSDVPRNIVYKWTEEDSIEVFLKPSGYTGDTPSDSGEPGSNGLALNNVGKLILCQHGDRRLAMLDAPLNDPQPIYISIADNYNGKKFNSPNDVAVRQNGDYFFTDPPYGMPRHVTQEIPFQGVYKVSNGEVTLLVDSLTRPNGIAFSPDEKTIIVANSDPEKAIWYAYELAEDDAVTNGRIFYDATEARKNEAGLPDGLKIDIHGNVFATGPGGIWIFDKEAKLLGKIKLPVPTANCAFSPDEKTLYITADNYLLRLNMRE